MAMLAEPRRKQKWSVDPRNTTWSKDESKFGQKMLEKMGWSKGKGLGKTEQGATEHIKVKVKNDSLGLGTTAHHEDNWIAHQDDFNQLLADLNNCHGQKESASEQKQSFSLEEKSKTSRKRVHYMKFTKGKDLSSRSETDLACIFGKRAKHQEVEGTGEEVQEEGELGGKVMATPDPEIDSTMNTVTSSLTMQEYFAQRMARMKSGCKMEQTAPTSTEASEGALEVSEGRKLKAKKNKKKRLDGEETEMKDQAISCRAEVCEDQAQSSIGRKKKRRRTDKEGTGLCSDVSGKEQDEKRDQNSEEPPCRVGGKKKRKQPSKDTNIQNEHMGAEERMGGTDENSKKKKNEKEAEQKMTKVKKSKKDRKN